jgi:YD repeat-containing protein
MTDAECITCAPRLRANRCRRPKFRRHGSSWQVLLTTVSAKGNVSGANAAAYTTTYAYASAGLLASVTNPDADETSYTYSALGYPLTEGPTTRGMS